MKAISVHYFPLLFVFTVTNAFGSSNTFYGDFRYSLNQLDVEDRSTQGENNASRIGFKGDFGQPDSLSAFYHLQMGVNIDGGGDALSERFYYAGLKGNFGSIVYGRTSTAYKKTGLRIDPFYDGSAGAGFSGSNFGLSPLTNGWTDNSLVYTTPIFSDFSFNAGAFLDDSDENNHNVNLGGLYKTKHLTMGIQYVNVGDTSVIAKSTPESKALRLHASSQFGQWTVSASIESIDIDKAEEQDYQYVSSIYKHSDKLHFAGAYGRVKNVSATADGNGYSIGAFYKLPTKTVVSLLYSTIDFDGGSDRKILSLGLSQKFSFTIR